MSTRMQSWVLLLGIFTLSLCWQFVRAQQADEAAAGKVRATTEVLGGADRYLTYVSTDKPIYRPGEKLYVRGVMLHALSNRPFAESQPADIQIVGPKGDVIASGAVAPEQGVYGFSWDIPASQAGGEYTAKFLNSYSGNAPAERKFDIRAYRPPRLRSQIKFLRDGYGPGDDVAATLEVSRAEGGVPAGAKVTIIARVDGAEAFRGEAQVSADGRCVARFPLPGMIERGEGSLAMVIEDGGVVETASKSIPILLQTVDLTMYPEGGDLIAGVPNRVYFEAFTPAKKPADLAGAIVDADGTEVAAFRSEHDGRGRFTFTPVAGQKYALVIREPAGIHTTYPLPAVMPQGVVMTSLGDTFDQQVKLQITSTTERAVQITLAKRETELAKQEVKLAAGEPAVIELSAGEASGVLVATIWDAAGRPLAERLVFSQPRQAVSVKVSANRPRYVPGGKASLVITTTDESGEPTSAVVGLTVSDDSVLEMIDKREQAPRLPVMALLEADVKDLADAHVYLDPQNPQAPAAVDLLLGTQGWRRFAFVDLAKFIRDQGDDARRAVALRLPPQFDTSRRRAGAFGDDVWNADRRDLLFRGGMVDDIAAGERRPVAALALEVDGDVNGAAIPADQAAEQDQRQAGERDEELGQAAAEKPADELVLALPPVPARDLELKQLRDAAARPEANARQDRLFAGGRGQANRRIVAGEFRIRNDFVAVREFAHRVRPDRLSGERRDFTETLYWNAAVATDDNGQATIEFDLSDAVSSFRVFADAFNANGALGSASSAIESVEPFYVEPKLPLEVTSGDVVLAPISLVNSTDQPLVASLSADAAGLTDPSVGAGRIAMLADSRIRYIQRLPIGESYGPVELTLTSKTTAGYSDKITRTMRVVPAGFPIERGSGGLLNASGTVDQVLTIPETLVAGSVHAKAVVYPTPLANMTAALERLIQQPGGCFEQTSSTVYPLVMAQQYFLDHQGVDPSLIVRSAAFLDDGYNRLVGFESKGGGYEWFGADPGHDALTAYGLLEFTDMARVRHVDPQMLARTRKWFLAQRDGKGGFVRKTNTLHTWLPDAEVANAYNTWAACEAGVAGKNGDGDFSTEIGWLREATKSSQNTYVLALAANVLHAAGDREGAKRLFDQLAKLQAADGSLSGATVSVVGSGGDALLIETTALAALAWLNDDAYAAQVEKSLKYLAESCQAGRFGSTQSTILALKAITAYDRARAKPDAPGTLQLIVDGRLVGEPVDFTTDTQGEITLPDFAQLLTPGEHQVQLAMRDGSQMPFSIAVEFFATKPDSSPDCQLDLTVALADTTVAEGELTEARIRVVNRSVDIVPNPIAIVGIPGGLEVRHDQLKELVKAGRIATYEVLGRDLVLYWRSLAGGERVELPVSLVAAIPGRYTGPASRAYLYYTDEHKMWHEGLRVEITPRDPRAK